MNTFKPQETVVVQQLVAEHGNKWTMIEGLFNENPAGLPRFEERSAASIRNHMLRLESARSR